MKTRIASGSSKGVAAATLPIERKPPVSASAFAFSFYMFSKAPRNFFGIGADSGVEEKAEQIVDSYLRAGEQGDWRGLDALVNRVYGRPTERIEQVAGESEVERALKQLSREDLQAMVQQGRQELEVKAIMRVMTAEERDEFLGRMAPEERRSPGPHASSLSREARPRLPRARRGARRR